MIEKIWKNQRLGLEDDYSQKLKHTDIIYLFLLIQGIDLKTRKQEYYCFLVEQFYLGQ